MADVFMNIPIDEKTKRTLEQIADREERSLAAQVRVIIDKWLSDYKED